MNDIYEGLTPEQLEAVKHIDGPMLVIAGAGSGKTRVVTCRIANLIQQGVPPWQILALTFTNKAAGEMAERVEGIVGPVKSLITTFHSACARWLRFDIERFECGRNRNFSIYDAADQKALIKAALKDFNLDSKTFTPSYIQNTISRYKTEMLSWQEAKDQAYGIKQEVAAKVYQSYERRLREANALDFDDLLLLAYQMFKANDELRREYQNRYKYMLVDEYQDTNRIQYLLLKSLVSEGKNIHVTGDPDQSIYSWRGANYSNIMDFESDYPGTRVVLLEQNYRSTGFILKASNSLISHNSQRYDKKLFTERGDGELVRLMHLPDDRCEAQWVASEIKALQRQGTSLRDVAIFYRVNAQSRPLEEQFMREGLPYAIVGGVRFYERMEIKDFLAYLRAINNPRDNIAFRRLTSTPPKGVGAKTLDALESAAGAAGQGMMEFLTRDDFQAVYTGRVSGKLKSLRDLCRKLSAVPGSPVQRVMEKVLELSLLKDHFKKTDDPRAEERLENIEAFVNRATEFDQLHPDGDLARFLEEVALIASVDEWDETSERVTFMTIHSAKGLEFPVIFVVGVEDKLLPHVNSMDKPDDVEEERRLLYVAMTRAEDKLYLSAASRRMQWGQINITCPSPFLAELPTHAVEELELADAAFAVSPELMPSMSDNGSYYKKKGPVGQGQGRKLGAGQPRRRTFEELEEDWSEHEFSDVDPYADSDDIPHFP